MKTKFSVKLINGEDPTVALAVVQEIGAGSWAQEQGLVDGIRWDTDGADFAFAVLPITEGLVERLRVDGYTIDASDFDPTVP